MDWLEAIKGIAKKRGYEVRGEIFGNVVYNVRKLDDPSKTFAMKVTDLDKNFDSKEKFENAESVMKMLAHKNIIQLYDSFKTTTKGFLILELAAENLFYYCTSVLNGAGMPIDQRRYVIREVLQAVQYMHSQGIAHGDIHEGNVLLTKDSAVKLCDFGDSVFLPNYSSDASSEKVPFKDLHRSPEDLKKEDIEKIASLITEMQGETFKRLNFTDDVHSAEETMHTLLKEKTEPIENLLQHAYFNNIPATVKFQKLSEEDSDSEEAASAEVPSTTRSGEGENSRKRKLKDSE